MTDKVQKIREELVRLKEETSIGLSEHENGVKQGRMEIINALSFFLDSLQKEPVSEDLEKEIQDYYNSRREYGGRYNAVIPVYRHQLADIARHFAQWQITKLVEEAGKYEVKVDAGGYPYIPQIELYDYCEDIPLAKEGDKYNVILIKED